jgi:hypothetical protein
MIMGYGWRGRGVAEYAMLILLARLATNISRRYGSACTNENRTTMNTYLNEHSSSLELDRGFCENVSVTLFSSIKSENL